MTLARLLLLSLRYHWRMHLAVCSGVVVATAVLSGSLLVGDSMRGSLRDLTLGRLGRIDDVLLAPRFFREELVEETADGAEFKQHFAEAVPAIITRGSLFSSDKKDRKGPLPSAGTAVIGCDRRFWGMCGGDKAELPSGRKVALSRALADDLGVAAGDAVVLRLRQADAIPADTTLGKKNDTIQSHRMIVGAVLADKGPARFALRPSQIHPRNVFVSLEWLQDKLDRPGMVNAMLVAANGADADESAADFDSRAILQRLLRPNAVDYGIRVQRSPLGYCNITSDRMLIPPVAEQAMAASLADFEIQPVLAYLANTISANEKTVPYSTVAAIDFEAEADGKGSVGKGWAGMVFLDVDGNPIAPLKDGEIVLNQWTARRLQAKPGDTVELTYFRSKTSTVSYQEETKKFRLVAVAAISGAAADRDLVPRVEGITDEATMADWNPPFPFDASRIGAEDEQYWEDHGATPKAFVSLAQGRRLWGNRFGETTSLRVAAEKIQESLKFDPAAMGFVFQPLKQQGLAASRGATAFEGLFMGLSFFIVAAAVLLIGLLFRLGMDNRAEELGILAALGWRQRRIVRLFVAEGLAVAAVGGVLGSAAGALYAKLMIDGLNTLWVAAIVVPFLRLHVTYASLAIGAGGGTMVAALAVGLSVRRIGLHWPRRLLAGQIGDATHRARRPQAACGCARNTFTATLIIAILAAVLLAGVGQEFQAGAFFAAGAILLAVLLLAVWNLLRRWSAAGLVVPRHGNILRLAAADAARHPGRSTLAMGLIAAAFFLIVAVGAFRQDPTGEKPNLHGANGGFSLFVQTELPVYHDLGDAAARNNLGFTEAELRLLGRCKIFSLRLRGGDDASCLNVYRPGQPRLLGLGDSLIERGGFAWADAPKTETDTKTNNPWRAIQGKSRGAIPVVLESNTAKYALHVGGRGTTFQIEDEQGRPLDVEIAALLAGSLFQGDLLLHESALLRLYPNTSGYGVFLIAVPQDDGPEDDGPQDDGLDNNVAIVQAAMRRVLQDHGATVETTGRRLASLAVVQNTYLSTFQSLGSLGLLLGTFGLAAVLMRNMVERRSELALLRAVGFRRSLLARMVAYENCILLLGGLGCGITAAMLAVWPQLVSGEAVVPWSWLLVTIIMVMIFGILAGMVAFWLVISSPLMKALRQE